MEDEDFVGPKTHTHYLVSKAVLDVFFPWPGYAIPFATTKARHGSFAEKAPQLKNSTF
jgi:hypothetical protein